MMERVTLDTRVLVVAPTSLACGLLTACCPRCGRPVCGTEPSYAGARTHQQQGTARQAIVMLQVAVATVLVLGSVVLLRSFNRLTQVDTGFQADHALLADVSLPAARYARSARAPFFARALDGIRGLPGVRAAGAGGPLPLSGQEGLLRFGVEIEGAVREPGSSNRTYLRWATAGYFEAMGIAQRAGALHPPTRWIRPSRGDDAAFARHYFRRRRSDRRRVRLSGDQKTMWVIGVVGACADGPGSRCRSPCICRKRRCRLRR